MDELDQQRLAQVCQWLNGLPVYMFSGELTAGLLKMGYQRDDLPKLDHAVRIVLNYQASLLEPMPADTFLYHTQRVLQGRVANEIVTFLARETTH